MQLIANNWKLLIVIIILISSPGMRAQHCIYVTILAGRYDNTCTQVVLLVIFLITFILYNVEKYFTC